MTIFFNKKIKLTPNQCKENILLAINLLVLQLQLNKLVKHTLVNLEQYVVFKNNGFLHKSEKPIVNANYRYQRYFLQ